MSSPKRGARQKVIDAAVDIAGEAGPANLSLDAVALRAGVSKGGLLYHFPSKAKLLEAVVEAHLEAFDAALTEREKKKDGARNSVMEAYLELFPQEHAKKRPAQSGFLAALAENPDLLAPARRYERRFLDRMKDNACDPAMATIVFLAVHGASAMSLLKLDVVSDEELQAALARIRDCIVGAG